MRAGDIHIIAWCFMDNHVHLIVHDEACRLSDAMHALLSPYARYFNKRSNHVGHVFQGPVFGGTRRGRCLPPEGGGICSRQSRESGRGTDGSIPMEQLRRIRSSRGIRVRGRRFRLLVLNMLGGPAGFVRFSRGLQGDGGFSTYEARVPGLAPLDRAKERAKPIMQTYRLASLRGKHQP